MSRRHQRLDAKLSARVRRQALERDRWRCVRCGKAGRLECGHISPLDRGGDPWSPENLQSLCRACHIAKTARENRRALTPGEVTWRELVEKLEANARRQKEM